MIRHILERLENRLKASGKDIRGSKAVILGLAFKADVSDTRNSPSIVVAERLLELGATVSAYDPFANSVSTKNGPLRSASTLELAASNASIIVLMTPHTVFKEITLQRLNAQVHSPATIVDTRGYWSPQECRSAGFDYVGLGRPDT
jgi:UDP-N-acetyl-D-mannosaminuronate dehydrogenase